MVAQQSARYEVHPGRIQAWKKALTEGASGVFGNGKNRKAGNEAGLIARLCQEAGQLKVEWHFWRRGQVHGSGETAADGGPKCTVLQTLRWEVSI